MYGFRRDFADRFDGVELEEIVAFEADDNVFDKVAVEVVVAVVVVVVVVASLPS